MDQGVQTDAAEELVVPGPEGPDDTRGPIGRFLGVPADEPAAQEWAFVRVEAATRECLEAKGFSYVERTFGEATDPNEAIMTGLAGEQAQEYSRARWGDDALDPTDPSCEDEAYDRLYPINSLAEEWDALEAEVNQTPAVQEAYTADTACLVERGFSDADAPDEARDACHEQSRLLVVLHETQELLEGAFLQAHADFFAAFRANLPVVTK